MLRSCQIHFIKADDIHLVLIFFRRKKEFRKARIGRAVNHIFHIRIAENITVVHPRRPHGNDGDTVFGKSQCLSVKTDQS